MPKYTHQEFVNKTFNSLTITSVFKQNKKWRVTTLCACGKTNNMSFYHVVSGRSGSCGCFNKEKLIARCRILKTKHGLSKSPEYESLYRAIDRCHNTSSASYGKYGRRGIKVCDRWRNNPALFIKDMGEKPRIKGFSLGRIDNNGDYTPDNCRWENAKQQASNTRRSIKIFYEGTVRTLKQWCEHLSLPYGTIYNRFTSGWDVDDLFKKPVRGRNFIKDTE